MDAIVLAELDEPLLWPLHVALNLVDGGLDGGGAEKALHLGRGEVGDPCTRFARDGLVAWSCLAGDSADMEKQETERAIWGWLVTNVFGLAGFDEVFHRLVRQVEAAGELDINEGPWVGWASVPM